MRWAIIFGNQVGARMPVGSETGNQRSRHPEKALNCTDLLKAPLPHGSKEQSILQRTACKIADGGIRASGTASIGKTSETMPDITAAKIK
ncbi:hypothetical protein OAA19_00945 [Rubripirellula sp.]|nr:hypothetical protein [Rubripirellula sp.]MDB4338653.1 hypothetical protein [Rubripirellula sp.]